MPELRIILPLSINVILTILFFLLQKKSKFKNLNPLIVQLIIGVTFGASAAFASEFGVMLNDTNINIRDSGPIIAGLVFGPVSGVVAGFIGGLYRALSILWGAGTGTVVACSISTFVAGIIASLLRIYMFDNKRPTWAYGVGITVVCEIFHMLMIFITNMHDIKLGFSYVEKCTLLMVIANSICVGLSIFIVSRINKDKIKTSTKNEGISQKFQRWLLACILISYVATSILSFSMQSEISSKETNSLLTTNISDVSKEIRETNDTNLLKITKEIKVDYEKKNANLETLRQIYDVSEINIIDKNGIIVETTGEHLNYDMASGSQSAAFLALLREEYRYDYFIQEYGPISYDNVTYRKYAAFRLKTGGFIQVGYSSERFRRDMDDIIISLSKYRHIGERGFFAVTDSEFNIICDKSNEFNGKSLSNIGIEIDVNKHEVLKIYEDEVAVGNYKENFFYTYLFNEGYYIIAAIPVSESMFLRDLSIYLDVFLQIIIFSTLFVLIYFLIKKVIINNLYKINSKLSEITSGNLDVVVDVRNIKEFSSLSDDINHTVNTLKRYIDEAASRIDKELEYAKSIQLSSLPSTFPAFPKQNNFDIYASMFAAKEVGGDFYDFYRIDKNKFAFLVADVSGKGIPAAMFMMKAKAIIKNLAEQRLEVNDIFTKANEMLCENNESGMFVTAWMGIIDLTTGVMKYANAGHNPPLIFENDEFKYLKTRPGFVLAGMEGIKYKQYEITLSLASRILLYTDGVTEATNKNQDMYGENKLIEFANNNKNAKTEDFIALLKEDIDNFVLDAPQFDDITILLFDLFKYKTTGIFKEESFDAKDECLDAVLDFLEEELNKNECPIKASTQIKIAIEEIFVNIAHYAYPDKDGKVKIMISFNEKEKQFTIHLIDNGIPFNPLLRDDPDITLSAEDRQIGGLGIYLTKKTMDNVLYTYENKQNILTIIKKI